MKDYILGIIVAGIVCGIVRSFVSSKTATGQILRLLTGVLMVITIASPVANISFNHITDYLDGLTAQGNIYSDSGSAMAEESRSAIIKEQIEAYILDKADRMDLDIAVEVALDDRNNSIPCGVTITGSLSPYAKGIMGSYIEEQLGIAKEYQQWK